MKKIDFKSMLIGFLLSAVGFLSINAIEDHKHPHTHTSEDIEFELPVPGERGSVYLYDWDELFNEILVTRSY